MSEKIEDSEKKINALRECIKAEKAERDKDY